MQRAASEMPAIYNQRDTTSVSHSSRRAVKSVVASGPVLERIRDWLDRLSAAREAGASRLWAGGEAELWREAVFWAISARCWTSCLGSATALSVGLGLGCGAREGVWSVWLGSCFLLTWGSCHLFLFACFSSLVRLLTRFSDLLVSPASLTRIAHQALFARISHYASSRSYLSLTPFSLVPLIMLSSHLSSCLIMPHHASLQLNVYSFINT